MKILYYIPSLESTYAARFIYEGYKDAFLELGHDLKTYTSSDYSNLDKILGEYCPNIFISSLNKYSLKYLDLKILKKHRDKGMVLFVQVPSWKEQNNLLAGGNLEKDKFLVKLLKDGLAGDVFFSWYEQDAPNMEGFEKETGYRFHTILLAANTNTYYPEFDEMYSADISYVGSYLGTKKDFMRKHLFPLKEKYSVKTYGSDWTLSNKFLGYIQKTGQYFNIDSLKHARGIQLPFEDERKVYCSSNISLNIHEDHQRKYGSDFNERTLKIPASGGFQIVDNVSIIRKYFNEDEVVMAEDTNDWFEKIDYYMNNPEKRVSIIEAGRKKVLELHTYRNRVRQVVDIYNEFKNG